MRQMPINDKTLQHVSTMIITCQNCQTNYNVAPTMIGGGKTVQCQNCTNSWYQNPVQAAPVYAAPPPAAAPAPPPPAPAPVPEPVAAPVAAPVPEPVPEPMPEPMPEPEPEETAAEEAPAEEAAAEPEADEPKDDAGAAEDALSPDQLNEMFGEDTETDGFFADDSDGGDGSGIDNLDDIEDPDPIPGGLMDDDDDVEADEKKKGGKGKIIGIAAVVLLLALGAGLFFGRSFIIDMVPEAEGMYDMIGIGGSEIGEGLDIQNVKSLREVESGVDVLIVRGDVANVSEEERMVPMIKVVLYDGAGEEIQSTVAAPLKNRLPPGAKIAFSAKLPEPSALARRLEVTFTEAKKE
jgi:predicted Zn finger-like uncharacterized protein